jgi:hypothetical protein
MNVKDVEKLHDEGWLYNRTLGIWLWTEDEELIQYNITDNVNSIYGK